jgi:hypothetical protein
MLSPGDKIRIDGGPRTWVVTEATRRGDLNGGIATNFYKVAGWPDPQEEITPDRITGNVVEG